MEWRDIPGYIGYYQASEDGQIRRITVGEPYVLKPMTHPRGYLQVSLTCGSHESYKKELVHRLVALAFLGLPPTDDAVVNHIDGDKHHNAWTNLEWVSQGANVEHYRKMMASREALRNIRAHENDPIPW